MTTILFVPSWLPWAFTWGGAVLIAAVGLALREIVHDDQEARGGMAAATAVTLMMWVIFVPPVFMVRSQYDVTPERRIEAIRLIRPLAEPAAGRDDPKEGQ